MDSPFYYGTIGDLANVTSVDANNTVYNGVINRTWAGGRVWSTWTVQPKDADKYGSLGDHAQDTTDVPYNSTFVLVHRSSQWVKPATRFIAIGNIISEANHKSGRFGKKIMAGTNELASVTVYRAACEDDDYHGVGLVFGRPDEPPTGQYFCVHKSWIDDGQFIPASRRNAINSNDPNAGYKVLRDLGYNGVLARSTEYTHLLTDDLNRGLVLRTVQADPAYIATLKQNSLLSLAAFFVLLVIIIAAAVRISAPKPTFAMIPAQQPTA